MAEAQSLDITRHRNDTYPIQIEITDTTTGVAIDVTGFSFALAVTTDPDGEVGTEQFKLTGTIDDAINGKVSFAPTALQADQVPDTYFFDIEQIDVAGKVRTIAKGKWIVKPDITNP